MSMPLVSIQEKIYFATVPLLFLMGVALVTGLVLSGYFIEDKQQRISLPLFHGITSIEGKQFPQQTDISRQTLPPARDIFSAVMTVPGQKEIQTQPELQVELNEIFLGMTIIKGEKRFCLTNGVLFQEGEGDNNFIVKRIEPDGVWYRVGNRDIRLQIGEKIYLETEARSQRTEDRGLRTEVRTERMSGYAIAN